MRVTKIICDRCREEIKGYPIAISPRWAGRPDRGYSISGEPPCHAEQVGRDYCESCTEKIFAYINGILEEAEMHREAMPEDHKQPEDNKQPEEEPQPQDAQPAPGVPQAELSNAKQPKEKAPKAEAPEPKGRRSVDIGKILALQKAGWKIKDMAGDMGMTEKAVRCALWRHKKKQEEDNKGVCAVCAEVAR